MTSLLPLIIASTPPTILALAALIASLRNSGKIGDVHLALNSRLTELIAASKAQGRQDERDAGALAKQDEQEKQEGSK